MQKKKGKNKVQAKWLFLDIYQRKNTEFIIHSFCFSREKQFCSYQFTYKNRFTTYVLQDQSLKKSTI